MFDPASCTWTQLGARPHYHRDHFQAVVSGSKVLRPATLPLCWLLVAGCWLLVAGCWLLVAGCWLLAAGCWLLVAARCLVLGASCFGVC